MDVFSTAPEPVLLTEWFPPAIGGSAELLWNVYRRLSADRIRVLTTASAAAPVADPDQAFRRSAVPFGGGLGMLGVQALAARVRAAWILRRTGDARSVVHCGRVLPEGLCALLSGRRFVCWTHGEELQVIRRSRELSWLARRVHRAAGALIANSRNSASMLVAWGNPAGKVHVVHPGVEAGRFRPDAPGAATIRRSYVGEDTLFVLSVGRLQARKGHDLALKALARISDRRFRYVIVGDGQELPRLQALTVDLGLSDRVVFAGAVDRDSLPGFYAASDIFLHPNRLEGADFEGFGLVFLEAAASGLPAVGGRSGGVPEAVEDGKTGFLVGGADVEELERALRRLMGSAALRTEMGRAGRARAEKDFTWEAAAQRVREIDGLVRTTRR